MAGLGECLQGVEAEADDGRREAEFVLGFRVVGGEHVGGGVPCFVCVSGGAGEEEKGEPGEDRFQDGSG